nr:unnamed protein product [Callosobruchus analis]
MLRISEKKPTEKMVFQDVNTGLPDPEHPEEDLPSNNETGVILVTDDESDDQETLVLDEYQPLAMEDSEESNHGSSEDEELENQASGITKPPDANLPPITPIEETLVKEVWSAPPPKDIEMDSKKVDEVKKAMANITLPPGGIPEWAESIPEEEWKQYLLKRLQNTGGE